MFSGRKTRGGHGKEVYRPTGVRRGDTFAPVDCCVRGYFVKTRHLHHVLRLRSELRWDGLIEDDLLLCAALRLDGRLPVLLTPTSTDPRERMDLQELPAPLAMSDRPEHYRRRGDFIRQVGALGWTALATACRARPCGTQAPGNVPA